jgi:leucine dehydrogenase
MTRLSGCYVTAEDLGVTPADMENIYSCTRFTTCIPEYIGGSGVPSLPTAHGVACGINAALDYLGIPLRNATVAIQGVGHVGGALALLLLKSGVKKIIASDVDSNAIKRAQETMASVSSNFELHLKEKGDNSILFSEVDIVSPCAVGATLNEKTIPYIKARAVCGAANNQLHDPCKDDKRLNEKGIIYIPDFLVNRMGIVNCCDEHVGYLHPHLEDPLIKRHLGKEWPNSIYCLINSILKESSITHKTTQELAVEMAERESRLNNPLYGHRGIQIIRSIQRQLEGSVNEGNAQ